MSRFFTSSLTFTKTLAACCFLVFATIAFTALPVGAQNTANNGKNDELNKELGEITKKLDAQDKKFQQLKPKIEANTADENELSAVQSDIEKLQKQLEQYREKLAPKLAEFKTQLDQLGPAPAKDAPPEPADKQNQRKQITTQFNNHEGPDKKAEGLQGRAAQIIRDINNIRNADEISKEVNEISRKLGAQEAKFQQLKTKLEANVAEESGRSGKELENIQNEIENLAKATDQYRQKISPRVKDFKSQLDKLGPAPAKDAPPESQEIQTLRKQLNDQFSAHDSAEKKAVNVQDRANKITLEIKNLRQQIFTGAIFSRSESPVSLSFWKKVQLKSSEDAFNLQQFFEKWKLEGLGKYDKSTLISILIFSLFLLAALCFASYRLIKRNRTIIGDEEPSFFHKITSAIVMSLAYMVPPIFTLTILYAIAANMEILTPDASRLALKILLASLIFFAITSLSRALLAPRNRIWRLFPLSDSSAHFVNRLILGIALVYAVNIFWNELNQVINANMQLTVSQNFIASLAFAFLLIAIALTHFTSDKGGQSLRSRLWPFWLKLPLWAVAITIIVSATLGFVAFAQFLSGQVIVTGAILAVAVLLHYAIVEFCFNLEHGMLKPGILNALEIELDETKLKQISLTANFILHILLATAIVPLILLQWEFSWSDIRSWLVSIFFGFQIGNINLSLVTLLISATLFMAGIIATRIFQKWLDRGPLSLPHMRNGLADSIRTVVGYIGFVLAGLLAVSYAGLDFTNLAILAGALSVGIGFGLQSIVNNFVSGLILLIERPIKVNDWVVIGDKEGYVRKISVRSTEIETFDRSSVLIPNSELITGPVTNWTHGNSLGRIIIKVAVNYDTDPNRVLEILKHIGENHPQALKYPAPRAVFDDFGPASLEFSLRIFVGNINESIDVRTELRVAILNAFRENGIAIYYIPPAAPAQPTPVLSNNAPLLLKQEQNKALPLKNKDDLKYHKDPADDNYANNGLDDATDS